MVYSFENNFNMKNKKTNIKNSVREDAVFFRITGKFP